jgi:hypothetical protein
MRFWILYFLSLYFFAGRTLAVHLDSIALYEVAEEPTVRPFITDDARVVGARLAQWESWIRVDRHAGQHWNLWAYGPTKWLEVTAGGVWGYDRVQGENLAAYALPLVQAKFLIRPYAPRKPPGVGLVVGTIFPNGRGTFVPRGYGKFAFATITQSVGKDDAYLFHVNVGLNYQRVDQRNEFINTWGIGTQLRVYRGFHWVGEVFSGDPYIPGTGTAYQIGFRHFFSEWLQIDGTVGKGIAGAEPLPFWASVGVRWVFLKN